MLESKTFFVYSLVGDPRRATERFLITSSRKGTIYIVHITKSFCAQVKVISFFFVISDHLEVYQTTETIIYDENGIPIRSGSPDEVKLSKSIKEEGPFNPKTGHTPG